MLCGVVLGLAVAVVAALAPSLSGSAHAADPELSPGMKKAIDNSLLVFAGEVIDVDADPTITGDVRQSVQYSVVRVLKGACLEARLSVQHVVASYPDADPKWSGLDRRRFAKGTRLILGVQLRSAGRGAYALLNSSRVVGAVPSSQPVEDAIVRYAKANPVAVQADAPKADAELDAKARAVCMNQLSQLSTLFSIRGMQNLAKAQRYSGPALWLQYRKSGSDIPRGQEKALLCPCDATARIPKTAADMEAWDTVDLEHPAAGLCSYAGRDFSAAPIAGSDAPFDRKVPIGACLHHPGGAVIAYASGFVEFLTLEELGLASDADKIVGPASKSPLLRVLR
jgi:hypothetical protein